MKKIAYDEMFENEDTHAWYIATREMMLKQMSKLIKKNSKIIDIGCGTGRTIEILEKSGYSNVVGIDKSSYAISLAKKRKIKNLKIGTANKLPFKNNSFDAAICLDVLYHQRVNPKNVFKEVYRILKKDGIFYSQEPAYEWLKSKHDNAIQTQRRFLKKGLKEIGSSAGFSNLKSTHYNLIFFLPILLKRTKDKILQSNRTQSDVEKLSYLLNNSLLLMLRIESKLIDFIDIPFGLSIINIWKRSKS